MSQVLRRLLKGYSSSGDAPAKKKRQLHVVRDDVEKPPSVIEIVEAHHERERRPKEGFFRPSMLFGCDRANVYHYMQVKPDPPTYDGRMQRVLDNGTAVHEVLQNIYFANSNEYWFVKESRVRIKLGDAILKGSSDGVFIRRKDGFKWGVEIKTKAHDEFMRITKPDEDHVFQSRIYMELQKLPFITIIYWDKDKQHLKEFVVGRDKRAWREVKDRVKHLYEFVDSGQLPAYDKAMCNKSFCRNVRACRRDGAPV